MEDFDAVVIGAGNGGLTTSAKLAQKGLKVLMLERHNIPGGAATSFCRGRFEFEVALHQLSDLGRPEYPGRLRMMLDELKITDKLEFVEMTDLYNVIMPDGFEITLEPDKNQIIDILKKKFPHESTAIEAFFDLIYKYAGDMLGAFIFKDPEASREKYPRLYRHAFRNSKEVLDEFFHDPLLKTVLSVYWGYLGVPPDRLAFAYLAMVFFTYIEFKPYHIKGGSQMLSNVILNQFLSHGGQARFNCGVKRILVENNKVKGIITENDEEISAKYVVSNASQVATYVQLIGADKIPEEISTEMGGRSLSASAFSMFIGFDCEPGELGITKSTNFLLSNIDITDAPADTMRRLDITDELLVLSCYDIADPEFSPPGACQANVVTLKYGDPWLRIPPAQYGEIKFRCAESMLKRVEQIFPQARKHIEEIEVATPLTHMRYLGHPSGAIYGYEQQTKDSMFFQPGRYSPFEGLYFVGGWSGDCGFEPTLRSGTAAAKTILRQLGME
jgi:phytoene dehydrogenase-like protein